MWDMTSSYRHRTEGLCAHNSPRMMPGWGWVTLLQLLLGQTNNDTISLPPSWAIFFFFPKDCLFRPFRPCFLFKEQVLPIQLQTPWPFPAVPQPSQGLCSWVSPPLLKALLWKPDPSSRKAFLVLESISPMLMRNRERNWHRKRGSETKPTFMTVIPESDI